MLQFNKEYFESPYHFYLKDGKVLNVLEDDKNGKYLSSEKVNNKSIVICLENLGWLEKLPSAGSSGADEKIQRNPSIPCQLRVWE